MPRTKTKEADVTTPDLIVGMIDRATPEPEPEFPVDTALAEADADADVPARPEMTSPEWNEYALSQFHESEHDESGNITTDGLRRVAELLLGPIIESGPVVVQAPNPGNGGRAAVVYWVSIAWGGDNSDLRRFGGGADVYADVKDGVGNTPAKYAKHAVASAETKAEGRALKKALKLRRIYTTEEMNKDQPDAPNGMIVLSQKRFIDKLCRDINIDVKKFVNSGRDSYADIYKVTYSTAQNMIKALNKYQQDIASIPEAIRGYDPDWEKS
jgi:hypothetical protein